MGYTDIYLYSPLSSKTVVEPKGRALLLQFILLELFRALTAEEQEEPTDFVFSSPATFFPYDWSFEVGCLNKVGEHAKLLPFAFPKLKKAVNAFSRLLEKTVKKEIGKEQLKELYIALEPFLIACKDSEELLLFLLKHADDVATLSHPENLSSLLAKMHPEGLDAVSHLIRSGYQGRGYKTLLPEIEKILSHYEK